MSRRRPDHAGGAPRDETGAGGAPSPVIQVGDVVLYAHRRMNRDVNGPDSHIVPMIVTTVFDNGSTVSGVTFSDNHSMVGYEGGKVVFEVTRGGAEGQWLPRP